MVTLTCTTPEDYMLSFTDIIYSNFSTIYGMDLASSQHIDQIIYLVAEFFLHSATKFDSEMEALMTPWH